MIAAVMVVALSYILPVAAMWMTGILPPAGRLARGPTSLACSVAPAAVALVLGGMMSAFGMFNALVMSYSRLPLAMAQDGMLPKIFGKVHSKTRVPWVAILVWPPVGRSAWAWASSAWSRSTF